jgi:phosphatidylserine/phosphatidylglycerophosphate/cardiolipin synthase-like enzyme
VKVHVLARAPHTLKKDKLIEGVGGLRILQDVGAKVHKPKGLRLHAKMLLADDARAIIGSINLTPGSFDARRELAIETDDPRWSNGCTRWRTRTGRARRSSTSPTRA